MQAANEGNTQQSAIDLTPTKTVLPSESAATLKPLISRFLPDLNLKSAVQDKYTTTEILGFIFDHFITGRIQECINLLQKYDNAEQAIYNLMVFPLSLIKIIADSTGSQINEKILNKNILDARKSLKRYLTENIDGKNIARQFIQGKNSVASFQQNALDRVTEIAGLTNNNDVFFKQQLTANASTFIKELNKQINPATQKSSKQTTAEASSSAGNPSTAEVKDTITPTSSSNVVSLTKASDIKSSEKLATKGDESIVVEYTNTAGASAVIPPPNSKEELPPVFTNHVKVVGPGAPYIISHPDSKEVDAFTKEYGLNKKRYDNPEEQERSNPIIGQFKMAFRDSWQGLKKGVIPLAILGAGIAAFVAPELIVTKPVAIALMSIGGAGVAVTSLPKFIKALGHFVFGCFKAVAAGFNRVLSLVGIKRPAPTVKPMPISETQVQSNDKLVSPIRRHLNKAANKLSKAVKVGAPSFTALGFGIAFLAMPELLVSKFIGILLTTVGGAGGVVSLAEIAEAGSHLGTATWEGAKSLYNRLSKKPHLQGEYEQLDNPVESKPVHFVPVGSSELQSETAPLNKEAHTNYNATEKTTGISALKDKLFDENSNNNPSYQNTGLTVRK